MLTHHSEVSVAPNRVVVLGARGFVGRALVERLRADGVAVAAIGSDRIDLAAPDAGAKLSGELRPGDTVVFLSALTPDKGRGVEPFLANVRMGAAVCAALERSPPAHVVYVSSDAVYPFRSALINESSCAEPVDLYGAMHLAREIMVRQATKAPVAILRPTLIYGAHDTHNSYGPNRLRRMAHKDRRITLFGAGEETRDHIAIGDVVALIALTIHRRSAGTLNLASGRSISYDDLARLVTRPFAPAPIEVACTPRQTPITHRAFDVTGLYRSFPEFVVTPLEHGLAAAHREELDLATRQPVVA
jgi:nucleoside-diphosphate-sugar epimerase